MIESSVEARQRLLGRPELVVLVVSCILTVAGLALPHAGGSPRLADPGKPASQPNYKPFATRMVGAVMHFSRDI